MGSMRQSARSLSLGLLLMLIVGSFAYQPTMSPSAAQSNTTAQPAARTTIYLPLLTNSARRSVPQATFSESFDGTPTSPQTWRSSDWDVSVHVRSPTTAMEPMQAQHGPDCGPPTSTHTINRLDQTVFICRDHLMTALNASDYGVIYLTPNQLVDFATGEAVIRWDMSTLRTSDRDWIDLWISPYEDHLQLPLQEWLPDLNGEPRRGIHIEMGLFNGETVFGANLIRNHNATKLDGNWYTGYEQFLTPDAARRDTFEVRISRTRLRVGMPQYNFWWIDTSFSDLGWSEGVVQFGHHSYNPSKDCNTRCGPTTWHWDNISLMPTKPFTIISANRAHASAGQSEVRFAQPAPAGGKLRFTALGNRIEVSFDGGATWQTAQIRPVEKKSEGTFNPYFTDIPAGTTSVRFRGQNWYGGGWMVRDPSIWAPPGS